MKILIFLIVIIFTNPFFAQTPNPLAWITDGYVNTIVVDSNYSYIGGHFTFVGPNTGCIGKLTTTNAIPNLNYPIVNGYINTSAPDGSGGWYIGGKFTLIGNLSRNNLAHINFDGSVDAVWNPNPSNNLTNDMINSIVISGSDIYVGGYFVNIGGQARNYIAKLNNTNGNADPSWNPNASSYVFTIAISGSDIYTGGMFATIGGQTRHYLAKLNNTNGNADTSWIPNSSYVVNIVTINGSDIYVGGSFSNIGGLARTNLAKLNNSNGNADATWNPAPNQQILTIAVSGSDIYAGGMNGYLAKLNNTTGTANATWKPLAGYSVLSIAISGNDIYAGGGFVTIGGQTIHYIAKLNNTNGAADATWIPNASNVVNTISISGSDIFVGGTFVTIGAQSRQYIAKVNNITGSADTTWNPKADGVINSIAISGSNVYAGGNYSNIGGQAIQQIAKLNKTNGNADASWNSYINSTVNTIAISGSDIYVGGNFTNIGASQLICHYIAKLNSTNGNVDTTWNPGRGSYVNSFVYAIAISGSSIYAGGQFSLIGGQTRYKIAKLNKTNGDADPTWNPNADGTVQTITLNGNNVYAGGAFSNIGGQIRHYIAKLDTINGTADATWNPNSEYTVNSIAISGSNIFVGGDFSSIGGQTINYIAKLNNIDGSADVTWNPNTGSSYIFGNGVYSIAINGNDLYVGGSFPTMGSSEDPNLAFFNNGVLPVQLTSFSAITNGSSVSLKWKTATEVNNYGFEVQRSTGKNSTQFEKIGFVGSTANNNSPKEYSFVNENPTGGTIFNYRLKQIDINGKYEYSAVLTVNLGVPNGFSLSQNYPNPFNPSTMIKFSIPSDCRLNISVFNILGQRVRELLNENRVAGNYELTYDASDLSSGVYLYRIDASGMDGKLNYSITRKMTFMK